jgi:hypothetical protein
VRSIDWGRARSEVQEISGMALRHVRVNREYQHALDKRGVIIRSDLSRERPISNFGYSLSVIRTAGYP